MLLGINGQLRDSSRLVSDWQVESSLFISGKDVEKLWDFIEQNLHNFTLSRQQSGLQVNVLSNQPFLNAAIRKIRVRSWITGEKTNLELKGDLLPTCWRSFLDGCRDGAVGRTDLAEVGVEEIEVWLEPNINYKWLNHSSNDDQSEGGEVKSAKSLTFLATGGFNWRWKTRNFK